MSNPQTLTQNLLLKIAAKLDLNAGNCPEVKAMEAFLAQAGKKKKGKDKKKGGDNKGKGKGEKGLSKKEQAKADEAAKLLKAAIKEGGKKGQDVAGLTDLGGVAHFHLVVETPAGNVDLLKAVMGGFNKEVDPSGDDRKGGSGDIAKAIFTYDDQACTYLVHVPNSRKEKLSAKDWAEELNKACVTGKIVEEYKDEKNEYVLCRAEGSVEKQLFPIKMRDLAINLGFNMLVKRELVMLEDSSDDEINYADDCGIEW